MLGKFVKGLVLCMVLVSLSACSTYLGKNKRHGRSGDNGDYVAASTQGVDDARVFEGSDMYSEERGNNLLEKTTFYFGFDRFDVDSADYDAIISHAHYLMRHPGAKVRVEGHTDERGSREYNIALGERRAKAVGNILQSEGVSPRQIHLVSYGQEKPVALGHDESAWQLNRRSIIVYEE